jgi:hypothetical protein
MFLRAKKRFKDGKEHRYWSVVENRRMPDNRVVQRQVLYLGEINDSQHDSWCKTIDVFQHGEKLCRQMALFPSDREAPELACEVVQIKLNELELHRPRQWGACWLACYLWNLLDLDGFWSSRLPDSRKKTRWINVLKILVSYRLIAPGSEWRLHRHWYRNSGIADLLGEDPEVIQKDKLYRCLDKLLPHKNDFFSQLADFLKSIEDQYGKANRVWVMDRGIPTEETLQTMREADPPIHYLVGTPKGRLTKLEKDFLEKPWQKVRDLVGVKLLEKGDELYVMARSDGRVNKERAMRRRRLKELQQQKLTRDALLLKIGAAKKEAGRSYFLVDIKFPEPKEPVNSETFTFRLRKNKLRIVRRREGCYLLRSNLVHQDPRVLWEYYIQLTEVEQAFKDLKQDLAVRPVYHQTDDRIDAHIFVSFMSYCLFVTLKHKARQAAPGLTARTVLEKFSTMQMVDVHLPTTDGRHLILPRYTQPDRDQKLLLAQLRFRLPDQPPPRIAGDSAHVGKARQQSVVPTF